MLMFRFPLPFFFIGICLSLMLANARAEPSRNLPAEMGAALWLKADEGLELDARGNGTVVSKWESKVEKDGKKLIATQSSNESARIEGNQTIANNKDAIYFPQGNATGGYGYFEILSNFNLKNSTVLVSLKHEGVSEAPRVLSFSANSTENDGQSNSALALMFHKNSPNRFRVESNLSNANDPKGALSPSYSSGNWTVLSYRIDENGNMSVSLDGVAGNQTSNPSMATTNTGGKTRIGLGSSGPNATTSRDQQNLIEAHIYEILIFNKYLIDNDNVKEYSEAVSYMQASMGASSVQINPLSIAIEKGSPLSQSMLDVLNASSNGDNVEGSFTWKNSTTVTQSGNHLVIFQPTLAKYNFLEFEILVTVKPELNTSTKSLTGFRTRNGTDSPSKSVTISGTNLTSNITASVLPSSGFEISTSTDNSTFGPNATIPVFSGNTSATLYVRLAAAQTSVGNKTATINIPFGAQSDESVRLEGTVVDASEPYIKVTPEVLSGFVTTAGIPSASANFTVNAYNLSGNLTANATIGFEIALGNGTYAQTLEIPLTVGNATTPINLRVSDSAIAGALSGSVTLTSGNTTASLSANGTVNAPAPSIIVAPEDLSGFVTIAGTPSASANFTVTATNLSVSLTASASSGFEIALGNGTYAQTLEIPLTGDNATTSLNLRVAGSASAGPLPGSVTLRSGNTTATLSANGTVAPQPVFYPTPASEQQNPEISKPGKKIKKPKPKKPKPKKPETKKPKKDKNSVFTFPQVAAASGSTWITPDGKVVSESQRSQSKTSK